MPKTKMSAIRIAAFSSILFVLQSETFAQTLHLVTENLPPRTFSKDGQIVGFVSDQVFEIMKRSGIEYNAELMPWTRAIGLAEHEANTCAFSTLHSEARHAKFKWIEPLHIEPVILSHKKGTPAPATLEAAKEMTVGAETGSAPEAHARQMGFKKVEPTQGYELAMNKLVADRLELVISTKSVADDFIKRGLEIEPVMPLYDTTISLACNPSVPDETVAKMNAALADMVKDGTQAKIKAAYQ